MSDSNTIRVLALDGGGERGYLSLSWLQKFITQWGINPADVYKNFDVICGTSVGGIMALSLAFGMTPEEMFPFFTVQGPYIFSLSSVVPSWRPNAVYKAALILADTPFYQSSGITADSYGSGLLAKTLQDNFDPNTLQNLKTNVVIPSYQLDTNTFVLFSNVNVGGFIGQNYLISDVGLATGAAPVYLPAWNIGGHPYIDGGIYQNNPAQFGVTLGKIQKPNANRICVLSVGTGRGELGFDPSGNDGPPPSPMRRLHRRHAFHPSGIGGADFRKTPIYKHLCEKHSNFEDKLKNIESMGPLAFDTIAGIFGLFEIASTGGQESVAQSLLMESVNTLDQLYYYRFNTILDPDFNTELDATDVDILSYYSDLATSLFNNDIDNISTFIGHLTA